MHLATGALVALQVAGTSLGFISWWRVQDACMEQRRIGDERQALLDLARRSRELYVHQAHTFIEGGPGHLGHLGEDAAAVEAAIVAAETTYGPFPLQLDPVRAAVRESTRWFDAEVAPLARDSHLDRATAAELHKTAEIHASAVQAAIDASIQQLGAAETADMARVSEETRRGWIAVAIVVVTGAVLAGVVSTALARRILGPINSLRTTVRAFAERQDARAAMTGDDEIAELGRAFNEMVQRVNAAEVRLVERERVQALGEIAGAVAHELMSPIMAILGETREDSIDPARIRAEADHARRVIQGLLGYARPGESEPTAVRLDEAACAAADRAIPFGDARSVGVRWIGGAPCTLQAAPTAVRQVLDNLVRNAVEASMAGDEVEVEVVHDAVEVRDRGPGLPPKVRSRLYEPFVTGRAEGTGLGLAVSQRIACALGGRILHLDRPGGGTVARWEVRHG
ncbi:HAMP domain-containing histidine kinase [Myxococcota bacterium]|nr:HAMP domain-containing histidine kinase [Myxococcota bacterium]